MPIDAPRPRLPEQAHVVILVNPAARGTHDREAIARAAKILEHRYRVETVTPATIAELGAAAREAEAGRDAIVIAGGDGTIHRVINALGGSRVPVGLLPLGTGNDLARALGVPRAHEAAADCIVAGRHRRIDLVEMNGQLFCTVGVLGVAADSALTYNRLLSPHSWTRPAMRLLGGGAYRLAGLRAMLRPGSLRRRLRIVPGSDAAGPSVAPEAVLAVFVTNARMLGSGMTLPIDADMADGHLELVWVPPLSRPRLLWAFLCLANGWRIPDGVIGSVRAERGVITSDRPIEFAADGELMCEGTRFDVAVKPGALDVIC